MKSLLAFKKFQKKALAAVVFTVGCVAGSNVYAAAYATGGLSIYKDTVLWLTWGGNNSEYGGVTPFTPDGGGKYSGVSSAESQIATGILQKVSCSFSQKTAAKVNPYRSGSYPQDVLDDLYNIGGVGAANKLYYGLATENGGLVDLDFVCSATLNGKNISLPGIVVADAESMASAEYITGTAPDGKWHLMEIGRTNANNTNPYNVTRSTDGKNIRLHEGGDQGVGAVTFLQFSDPGVTRSFNVKMKGGGVTAMAIGVIVPYADFGDAPARYGDAAHLLPAIEFENDGLPGGVKTNIGGNLSFKVAKIKKSTTDFLGTTGASAEAISKYSDNADKDNAGNEEDAWPDTRKLISVDAAKEGLKEKFDCSGTGYVRGWIDFNGNGRFDGDAEASIAGTRCNGQKGFVFLQWNTQSNVATGKSYARLRYALKLDDVANPTGVAESGEVEDHQITFVNPKLELKKEAVNGPWVWNQSNPLFKFTVTNTALPAQVGTSNTIGEIVVTDTLPAGLAPNWTGTRTDGDWACTFAGQVVTCKTKTVLAQNGGVSSFSIPVKIEIPLFSKTFTNPARVYGGESGVNIDTQCSAEPKACSEAKVDVTPPPLDQLTLTKSNPDTNLYVGKETTYKIVLNNGTATDLSGVVLKDIPDTAKLDCTNPKEFVCTPSAGVQLGGTCDASSLLGQGVKINKLPMGGNVTITLSCKVKAL